jgi:chemotaxis protein histidine kinase CheA
MTLPRRSATFADALISQRKERQIHTDPTRSEEAARAVAVGLLAQREQLAAQREIREYVIDVERRRLDRLVQLQEQLDSIQARVERVFDELEEEPKS